MNDVWYVLQVKTGTELTVKKAAQEKGFAVMVPRENRAIRSGGSWGQKEYTLFPGYVFLDFTCNADNYYKVIGIPNVQRILGTDGTPVPLSNLEAEWIKILAGKGEPIEPSRVRLNSDGSCEILDGVLRRMSAQPITIDKRSRRAKVEITICGEPKTLQISIEPDGT